MELGHPADREETDMTCVCACIPEMPKIVNGDLYAYVDILDTPNGRLLKTFCDYGFIPGISSRGSGDILDNDEVDPDTFFLETFDIVAVPAVKKARLSMCESYSGKTLKQALAESYNSATEKEKLVMNEALNNLNMNLNIKLNEEADDAKSVEDEQDEQESDSTPANAAGDPETFAITLRNFIKELKDFDADRQLVFSPIVVDDKKLNITDITFDDESDNKIVVNFDYSQETDDNIDNVDDNKYEEESEKEDDKTKEEATNDGSADDFVESLKEAIRKNNLLESELRSLKADKTVSDTKVTHLTEELNKYKSAFERVGEVAATAITLKKNIAALKEDLESKNKQINRLKEQSNCALAESKKMMTEQATALKESFIAKQKEFASNESKLEEQLKTYKRKLAESASIVNSYKNKYTDVLDSYISFRASMLGVRPNDILSLLSENYAVKDIDAACEKLLTESSSIRNLNFGNRTPKIKINEVKEVRNTSAISEEEDTYQDLLELAGLK